MLEIISGDRDLDLFWVDADGARHAYGVVVARGRRVQHTYAGHVWEVSVASAEQVELAGSRRRYRVSSHPEQLIDAAEDLG